ncbi:MAG TPA: DUF1684 domain-containing protein [Terriglobales bacterium]|nr:DUF1684 domain-containing protein [Terriglobales bacterium]
MLLSRHWIGILLFGCTACLFAADTAQKDSRYQAEIMKWRQQRVASLKENWLPLVGLFWLKEGNNQFGSNANDPVLLPRGKAPEQAGIFVLQKGVVSVKGLPGSNLISGGKPVTEMKLKSDVTGYPTILELGDLRMHVIQRNERFGIRVKDTNSERAREFTGLTFFPIQESYRVVGKFVPFETPKKLAIPTVLGESVEMESPGYVEFTVNGTKARLTPLIEDDPQEYFFIMKDLTSGKETYPAGRFLYAHASKDGKVTLDFNKAFTPPCGYTPYATCPLPPRDNYLQVAITAGEKYAGHH